MFYVSGNEIVLHYLYPVESSWIWNKARTMFVLFCHAGETSYECMIKSVYTKFYNGLFIIKE